MDRSIIQVEQTLQELYEKPGTRHGRRRVSEVALLGSGYEADVYTFSLEGNDGGREERVLRVYAGEGSSEKAAREFAAMSRLREAKYPVPRVLLLGPDPSPFGRPFLIMERIHGGAMEWSPPAERREALQTVFYRLLVQLHALEGSRILPDHPLAMSRDAYASMDHELSFLSALLNRLEGREPPSLRAAFAWLESRRSEVPCTRFAVVHGDFHRNNILLRADGAAVVIDWSNVRLGDCRSDLAWTRLVTSTTARPGDAEAELRMYRSLGGKNVSGIEVFDVVACMRQLLSVLISLRFGAPRQAGTHAVGGRPEAAALMRRDTGHVKHVAALLQARTGINMPDLDDALCALLG
jgi:aminoglycoside phosphotransferase (APT) family kinase protein